MATGLALAATAIAVMQIESASRAKPPSKTESRSPSRESESRPEADRRTAGAIAALRRIVRTTPGYSTGFAEIRIGRSAQGRPIRAFARNGLDDGPLVLVFGCIHGTECAGSWIARGGLGGCPPFGGGIVVVPNLNPDGLALGTRLNANGVDLNRNFSSRWRPIGVPGDLQHSGPRAFSEPESRLARRLIEALRPDVTVWFHQQTHPLVRAWGPSVPAARTYARLARTRFYRLPWLAGTAPNWQNHRFPGTSSFVVELAAEGPTRHQAELHSRAIFHLAHAVDQATE